MTKRKKILAMLAGGALGALMPVSILASDTSPKEITLVEAGSSSAQFEATGSHTGNDVQTKYRVEITWGSMEFTYQAPSPNWNTETLTYETGVDGVGFQPIEEGVSNLISLTNHSNANIDYAMEFQGAAADGENISETIQGNFDHVRNSLSGAIRSAAMNGFNEIEPGDTETQGKAGTLGYKLYITDGALMQSDAPVSLGTITITIS